jgi:sec-independent protein translocase protein TatA
MTPLFAFGLDNPVMLLLLGAVAVLLFGERLPEVARSFGKGLMEVKNGMRELQKEMESTMDSAASGESAGEPICYSEPEDREEATAPKFVPPPSNPGS